MTLGPKYRFQICDIHYIYLLYNILLHGILIVNIIISDTDKAFPNP